MKKQIPAMTMICVMSFGLTACGGSAAVPDNPAPATVTETSADKTESVGEVSDNPAYTAVAETSADNTESAGEVSDNPAPTAVAETSADNTDTESVGEAPDYSQEDCWLQLPEITKDVDTFYIYSTTYVDSSFDEGSTDYATLDNPEMVIGAMGEYVTNSSVYEDSTNVFVPYFRQAGMRYAGEIAEKTGDIDAALSGISYDD